MKIVLLLRRIGPYHHARFNHAGQHLHLHIVETRPGSEEYPWEKELKNQKSQLCYQSHSLGLATDLESGWHRKELKDRIRSILDKVEPDVIVTTGWADKEYHMALLWAKRRNIPGVVISDSTRNDVRRYRILEWIKKQIISNYSSALVAGKRSQRYLQSLGMNSGTIFTPWDVVDNNYFYSFSKSLKKNQLHIEKYSLPEKFLLCVSRFIPKKNIPGLIRAYGQFTNTKECIDIHLVILGSGEMETEIREYIENSNLKNFIHLFGFVQYTELPFFYGKALALILPSFFDQWGLVVNEALACEIPVIVSKTCGCVEDLVFDGKNGYVIDPNDIESISRAMAEVVKGKLTGLDHNPINDFELESFTSGLRKAIQAALKRPDASGNVISRIISLILSRR